MCSQPTQQETQSQSKKHNPVQFEPVVLSLTIFYFSPSLLNNQSYLLAFIGESRKQLTHRPFNRNGSTHKRTVHPFVLVLSTCYVVRGCTCSLFFIFNSTPQNSRHWLPSEGVSRSVINFRYYFCCSITTHKCTRTSRIS